MPNAHKLAVVEQTAARMKAADAIYFAEFKGLSAPDATTLRAALRSSNVDLFVAKKTLIRLAAKEAGLADIGEFLTGQMAMAFAQGEPSIPAKILSEFSKTHEGVPSITGIILNGEALPGSAAAQLASLPSKDVLLGQFAATLIQPITRLAGTLNGAMLKLAQTLNSLQDKKTS